MDKRVLIICRGIQGSGKSTWAKQWCHENPEHRVRFNNDDIRNMLGEYWVPSREGMVTELKRSFACEATRKGYDIVVDNMNLNPKEVGWWEDVISVANSTTDFHYELEFKDFFIPVEECIRRDAMRPNPIGEKVIKQTWSRYRDFIFQEDLKNMLARQAKHVDGGQPAIIVDIDGTLCHNTTGRPFFGEGAAKGMLTDTPIEGTCQIVKQAYEKFSIIIITGREGTPEIREATQRWLAQNGIRYDKAYFRSTRDYSKAEDCKQKIYEEHIKGKYNILYVLEDNYKCVNMWRNEGLVCLQPNEGKF